MTRILVVDDKEENLYLLRGPADRHGCTVGPGAATAPRRSSRRASATPVLVISDLLMPVMDGYTLLRQWKADPTSDGRPRSSSTPRPTPSRRTSELALDLGADAFILKPTEPEPFMQRVNEVLQTAYHCAGSARDDGSGEVSAPGLQPGAGHEAGAQNARSWNSGYGTGDVREHILRLNRFYAALSETNKAIVHAADRERCSTPCATSPSARRLQVRVGRNDDLRAKSFVPGA